jgi:alginate O-acetyltransferase complex protein AlgJ
VSSDPPATNLTREEIAQREIGQTDISHWMSWSLIVSFLLTLAIPPVAQISFDISTLSPNLSPPRTQEQAEVKSPQKHSDFTTDQIPSCLQFFTTLPALAEAFQTTDGGYLEKLLAANRQLIRNINDYERQLEERSLLTRNLLGPTRWLFAKYGGIGSDQAEPGRDGWLFFRPDLEHLTGPGFLEPEVLQRQSRLNTQQELARQSDPRRAILDFHEQLAARGIRLIVMPTPGKPAIYPEHLSIRDSHKTTKPQLGAPARANATTTFVPLQNASFDQFTKELKSAGVLVFDPAIALAQAKQSSGINDLYLRTDTHWTPVGIEAVARRLSEFIERELPFLKQRAAIYQQRAIDITNLGDIAVMLRLPPNQTLFPPERITVQQVEQSLGGAWQLELASEILLLGDSFTNIYSLREMNWGTAAGLAEQLSFHLQRPVDRIAQNNGGAFATRQALFQELSRGNDRLAGKRLVIWQFATRDLTTGDWKRLSMPTIPSSINQSQHPPPITDEVMVRATIQATAGVPNPGTVPYRDAVTGVHLIDVKGQGDSLIAKELIVYLWGLQDNQRTLAARFTKGQQVTLKLVPWENVKERYERFNRIELDDPDFRLIDLPTYWGEFQP